MSHFSGSHLSDVRVARSELAVPEEGFRLNLYISQDAKGNIKLSDQRPESDQQPNNQPARWRDRFRPGFSDKLRRSQEMDAFNTIDERFIKLEKQLNAPFIELKREITSKHDEYLKFPENATNRTAFIQAYENAVQARKDEQVPYGWKNTVSYTKTLMGIADNVFKTKLEDAIGHPKITQRISELNAIQKRNVTFLGTALDEYRDLYDKAIGKENGDEHPFSADRFIQRTYK